MEDTPVENNEQPPYTIKYVMSLQLPRKRGISGKQLMHYNLSSGTTTVSKWNILCAWVMGIPVAARDATGRLQHLGKEMG